MSKRNVTGVFVCVVVLSGIALAQSPAKVDFRRDVQPLFKANCIGCHGPAQQMNGFRLDRRSAAMKGGTIAVIGPGNSAGSRLYMRLIGNNYGMQMPPTGPLSQDQINIVKAWIDEGAPWPDDLAGETPPPPADPKATRLMEALRRGDAAAFQKALGEDSKAVNGKGPGGSTPLMYAVFYGDTATVRLLLEKGANPNVANDAGATALMWAAGDLEKTRLLVDHGADVNARSDGGRTPLMITAGRFGSGAAVKFLLEHGANPSATASGLVAPLSVLSEAASTGDDAVVEMLIEHGADVKAAGLLPLPTAAFTGCAKCLDAFAKGAPPEFLNAAAAIVAPPLGDASAVKLLLDRGASVNASDPAGDTILMLAVSSEAMPVDLVKRLIDGGADVNAKNSEGMTALDFARRNGHTPVVDLLIQAGAKQASVTETKASAEAAAKPKPAASPRDAVARSIPALQKTDVAFLKKAGCVSCHNNTLTAMTVAAARKQKLPVDDQIARSQLKAIAAYLDSWRERALLGVGIPGEADTIAPILVGLAAQSYPPDAATDAMAAFLKSKQLPNGMWAPFGHRPPLEMSAFVVTAQAMRALQVYAPRPQRAEYQKRIELAAAWLAKTPPQTNHDRAFQLLGLAWSGGDKAVIKKAAGELVRAQRPDGGWSQIPTLASDAYATGQALVALKDSGAAAVTDPAYQRGVRFLLNSQFEDGSWHVKTRAMPIQPYFESGFPFGHDQWISASATNWATQALVALASPESGASRTGGQ
jgi:ankyrin repeat protein